MSCFDSGASWPVAPPTPITPTEYAKPTTPATLPPSFTREHSSNLSPPSLTNSSTFIHPLYPRLESIAENGRKHVQRREQQRGDFWEHNQLLHTALERMQYILGEHSRESSGWLVAEMETVVTFLVDGKTRYSALLFESHHLDDDVENLQKEFENLVPLRPKTEIEPGPANELARGQRPQSADELPSGSVETSNGKPPCLQAYEKQVAYHRQLHGRVGELKAEYQEEVEQTRVGGLALPDEEFEAKYFRDLMALYGQIDQAEREAKELRRECEAAGVLQETDNDKDSVQANAEPALPHTSFSPADRASATASELTRRPLMPRMEDTKSEKSDPMTDRGLRCRSPGNRSDASRSEHKSLWPRDLGVPNRLATPTGNIQKQHKIRCWNDDVKSAVKAQKSGRAHRILVTRGSAVNNGRLEAEHELQHFHHTLWGQDTPNGIILECPHCEAVLSWAPPQTTPNTPIYLLINQDLPLPNRAHTF